jgi:hypothetical protein
MEDATDLPENRQTVWSPTGFQFLYKHRNGRYYVRTFAGGKEKWSGLKTKLMSVARNRMKEHVIAAERQRASGSFADAVDRITFGQAVGKLPRAPRQRRCSPQYGPSRKINVGPEHADRLGLPGTAKGNELDKLGGGLAFGHASVSDQTTWR